MSDVERDPIYLAAADWFARLREPNVSVEQMLAWQHWMGESERHAQAFTQIEHVSRALRQVTRPTLPAKTNDVWDLYDASIPLSSWRGPLRPRLAIGFGVAASVVIAGIVAGWMLRQEPLEVLRTAVGENRTVKLTDGSTVVLGGNTQLKATLDRELRQIELAWGEAFFVVAKDSARPFKVKAGDATVVAVGTEFNVRRGADRVVVAVTEGRVIVEPTAQRMPLALLRSWKSGSAPVPVIAGEQTTVGDSGIAVPARSTDPAAASSWRSGRLSFQLETLRHVLEDVNRYAPKPIVLEEEAVGNLRITATVVGGNVEGLITSMERAFGLEAVEERDRIVLRQRG